ncbi:MAG: selenide, water dikinase SelD [Chloroflexota bacterium]|nr:selenide, water dikinase SelD [Chloroflexota bacterium]
MSSETAVRLSELTQCGGCAAKLGADVLTDVLKGLNAIRPEALLVGLDPPDDAAVYEIAPGTCVVATVDFFPPIVDDPFVYGSIAATNALSDIYAMGGRFLFALNIAAIPESLSLPATQAIFAGGSAVVNAAGGVVAGGHTVRDAEPKYGLAAIGIVDAERIMLKGSALEGDVVVLTKRLGTGLIVSGHQRGIVDDGHLEAAVHEMLTLNDRSSEVCVRHGVRAATDVTGFGLVGHALEMANASDVAVVLNLDSLPSLPGALDVAQAAVRTDGSGHNRRFAEGSLRRIGDADPRVEELAFDPQTSGGLLIAVRPELVDVLCADLERIGGVWRVGHVERGSGVVLTR